ncbi:GTPase activating protein [Niveomyces insectorum RCEF 264]|uniref:GTPase activating protein n=1 Tax=Niveomyces insectorum RCEF 264 TaxID=1081102 RepID=A0A167XZ10_9HYPO|nr:GTPase activating protein [Niveomyces insectorum RCEF 264]
MAFSEQDDAAYAADVEGPAPSSPSLPSPSSFSANSPSKRQRSIRKREFGLYANRLRRHQPQTKHDDAASDDEPLGFGRAGHAAANTAKTAHTTPTTNGVQAQGLRGTRDDDDGSPKSNELASTSLPQPFFPRRPNQPPSERYTAAAYEDDFGSDNGGGLNDDSGNRDEDHDDDDDDHRSPLPSSHPASPISPRWDSLANSATVLYNPVASPDASVSAPLSSSVHTSVASASVSTAPTSPVSPTPSVFFAGATKLPARSPSTSSASAAAASASARRFALASARPSAAAAVPPERDFSALLVPAETRNEPFPGITTTVANAARARSPATFTSEPRTRTPPPGASGAMLVGNFSRPRQASIKQGTRDVYPTTATAMRLRPLEPIPMDGAAPPVGAPAVLPATQSVWPRERARGLSLSSAKSTSTTSSLPHRAPDDTGRSPRLDSSATSNGGMTSPGLPRPPVAYSRTDSTGSAAAGGTASAAATSSITALPARGASQTRDPAPWLVDEEARSSYRSQWTASTAQRTVFTDSGTPRSSVLTKTSSRTTASWFANAGPGGMDEGLSVDDVMGMYEKGFGDSTGAEDNDLDGPNDNGSGHARDSADDDMTDVEGPGGNGNAASDGHQLGALGSGLIGSQILEAMSDSLPVPSSANHNERGRDDGVLDAPPSVRHSNDIPRLSSSAPGDTGFGLAAQHAKSRQLLVPQAEAQNDEREKRDSAKMLESDVKIPAQPSPAPSPQLDVSFTERLAPSKSPSLFARSAQDEAEDPGVRDRYGFRKHNQYITREQYDAWNGPYTEYIGRRRRKWVGYLKDSGLITDNPTRFPPPSVKTKRFIRKGIPPEWRGAAWFYYAGGPSIVAKHPGIYDRLIARVSRGEAKAVDVESIERDLHRTFPDNVRFQFSGDQRPGHGDNQQAGGDGDEAPAPKTDLTADRPDEPTIVSKLRRVLLAFSIYNPRIGYCQSLNFLAGLLLLFVQKEEQSFWLLNVITRIFLPGTHEMSLEGSKVDLSVLMAAMQESLPGVWAKIGGDLDDVPSGGQNQHAHRDVPKYGTLGRKMKVPRVGGNRPTDRPGVSASSVDRLPPITLCMTAWFMSCFIGTLPIETTLRVWDIFFYEGSKTLFRVALAIFKLGESEIRAVADPMEMFGVVQTLPRRLLDCNMLMEATFRRRNGFGHLSQETIEEKRRERRDAFKDARTAAAVAATAATGAAGSDAVRPPASASGVNRGAGSSGSTNSAKTTNAAGANSAAREVASADAEAELTAAAEAVYRKNTLFSRRRDRHFAAEVM